MKALVLVLGAGLLAFGCQKSEPAAPPAASAAPVAAPAAAPVASAAADPAVAAVDTSVALNTAAAAAPAVAAKAVPTEADYEVQAQSTITPTNAAQVLAAIDKQVGN
jgi:hypothetical protein